MTNELTVTDEERKVLDALKRGWKLAVGWKGIGIAPEGYWMALFAYIGREKGWSEPVLMEAVASLIERKLLDLDLGVFDPGPDASPLYLLASKTNVTPSGWQALAA